MLLWRSTILPSILGRLLRNIATAGGVAFMTLLYSFVDPITPVANAAPELLLEMGGAGPAHSFSNDEDKMKNNAFF